MTIRHKETTPIQAGEKLVMFYWVPATFWDDHADRCPSDTGEAGICVEVRRSGRRVLVSGTFEQVDCLKSDAMFYAEGNADDCANIIRSAKRTLSALA